MIITCNATTKHNILISAIPEGSERKLPTSIKEELTHHQLAQFGVRRYAPLFRGGREMQRGNAQIPALFQIQKCVPMLFWFDFRHKHVEAKICPVDIHQK
jgi:hypothetical protein